jgi:YaiO family outer membrane protein
MKKALIILSISILALSIASPAHAVSLYDEAHTEANRGDYASALQNIDKILKSKPKDFDARLLRAQIYGWQKSYDGAEKQFDILLAESPGNSDVLVARGYLYYAEEKLDKARADFSAALKTSPNYRDALEGLELSKQAQNHPDDKYKWQLDAGGEYSAFARAPTTSWDNEFIQLTRFLEGGTALHAMVQRYHQFEESDVYSELGIDQTFTPYLNAYLYGGGTPDPGFRPRWHVASGGTVRLTDVYPSILWVTLDTRYDDYPTTEVGNLNPGMRMEFADNWALSGTMITVIQSQDATKYGWQAKLDAQAAEGWRPYLGYAIAPETVNGVTVNTQSLFLGTAVDVNPANTLHFGYTHDDRENSYIRHAVNASISHRF